MKANPFSRQAAFRSALMMTGSTYATYATSLVVSSLIARSLGPERYGHYAYLVWMSGFLIIVYIHGLVSTGIRYIGEAFGAGNVPLAQAVHGRMHRWYWWGVAFLTIAFLVTIQLLRPSGWEQALWMFALTVAISAIGKSEFLLTASMAKGYGQYGVEARTTSILSLVNLVGTLTLFAAGASLRSYVIFFVVLGVLHSILAHVELRRLGIRFTHDPIEPGVSARMREHLIWSALLALAVALGQRSIETYLLNETAGATAVAYFAVAAALSRGGSDLLSTGLNAIMLPAMAHGSGAGAQDRVNRITVISVRYAHFLGVLLIGAGVLWAPPIVNLLYGSGFSPAARLLQILVVASGLTMSNGAFGATLTTTDNQRARALVIGFSVAINIATAFYLVPRYGIFGAAASAAASSLLVFALVVACTIVLLKVRIPAREIILISVAGAIAILPPIGLLLIDRSMAIKWLSGAIFVLVYALATVVLRVWRSEDLDTLDGLARRLPIAARVVSWLRPWVYHPPNH